MLVGSFMMLDVVVVLLLVLWLLVSIVNQLYGGKLLGPIRRLDVGSLVPGWTFFAPRPGVTDHVLLYRDVDAFDQATPWRALRSPVRATRAVVWHPEKRVEKLITDCASALIARDQDAPPMAIEVEYLLLQRLVERAEHDCRAIATQFVLLDVAQTRVHPSATPLIVSPQLPLNGAIAR